MACGSSLSSTDRSCCDSLTQKGAAAKLCQLLQQPLILFCLFICSVLSAVGILVPAIARVVIGLALGLKLVDDDAEYPASALLELGDDLLRLTVLQLAVADDEKGTVTAVGCDSRINDPAKGRGVDKDIVIALSLLLYQRGKILSTEKLDRIRRIFAGEDERICQTQLSGPVG